MYYICQLFIQNINTHVRCQARAHIQGSLPAENMFPLAWLQTYIYAFKMDKMLEKQL